MIWLISAIVLKSCVSNSKADGTESHLYSDKQWGNRYTRSIDDPIIPTFPETLYPITILDTMPFYFLTEAQDILSPFEKDVQESFKCLETKSKSDLTVRTTSKVKEEVNKVSVQINNISQTNDSILNTSITLDEYFSETDCSEMCDTIYTLDSNVTFEETDDFNNEWPMFDIESSAESPTVFEKQSLEVSKTFTVIEERNSFHEDLYGCNESYNNLFISKETNKDNEYNFTIDHGDTETTEIPLI